MGLRKATHSDEFWDREVLKYSLQNNQSLGDIKYLSVQVGLGPEDWSISALLAMRKIFVSLGFISTANYSYSDRVFCRIFGPELFAACKRYMILHRSLHGKD